MRENKGRIPPYIYGIIIAAIVCFVSLIVIPSTDDNNSRINDSNNLYVNPQPHWVKINKTYSNLWQNVNNDNHGRLNSYNPKEVKLDKNTVIYKCTYKNTKSKRLITFVKNEKEGYELSSIQFQN